MACGNVINVVANSSRRIARRATQHGEGAASHLEGGVTSGDLVALADDAEPVERIGKRCGIERGGARHIAVFAHFNPS